MQLASQQRIKRETIFKFGLHVYHNESNEIYEPVISEIINSTPKFPGIQKGYCKISNIGASLQKNHALISEGCLVFYTMCWY